MECAPDMTSTRTASINGEKQYPKNATAARPFIIVILDTRADLKIRRVLRLVGPLYMRDIYEIS